MAGLLTGPGSGLLEESVMAGLTGNLFNGNDSEPFRTSQLRAQFRIRTGFPFEPAGKDPGQGTIIWNKDKKKAAITSFYTDAGQDSRCNNARRP